VVDCSDAYVIGQSARDTKKGGRSGISRHCVYHYETVTMCRVCYCIMHPSSTKDRDS
jgi:hypothetical protein